MHFRPLVASAALALAVTPAAAGGYVAPFPVTPIFAPAPVAAPAPGFTLCGEPVVCAALALLIIGALVGGRDHDAPPKVVVPPIDPVDPEPSPVPLPLSGVLLAGALAGLPLIRRRRSLRAAVAVVADYLGALVTQPGCKMPDRDEARRILANDRRPELRQMARQVLA